MFSYLVRLRPIPDIFKRLVAKVANNKLLAELYVAIPQALGAVDISDVSQVASPGIPCADSILALRGAVDKLGVKNVGVPPPVLVKSLEISNIVFFNSKYYVIPHALGEVYLEREDIGDKPGVHITDSLEQAMKVSGI
jgi:hypothetical protein